MHLREFSKAVQLREFSNFLNTCVSFPWRYRIQRGLKKKNRFFFITEIDTECHETSLDTIIREFFCAGSRSKITFRVKKVANNFTVEMDAE